MDLSGINSSAQAAFLQAGQQKLQSPAIQQLQQGQPLAPNKIREAAAEFEAVFLSQMLTHMFKGIEPDPLFGGGKGEEIYQSFMVDEYAKILTEAGGIGVPDHVAKELLKLQEVGYHD